MSIIVNYREIYVSEFFQLENFLFEAIYISEGQKMPDREIIKLPELSRYIKNFGQKHDLCFIAETEGKLIGAVWTRIFTETEPGYGFVDANTPELSISVLKDYQQKGIGTNLMHLILNKLTVSGYEQVSLSVDKQNYARRMYEKSGFKITRSDNKSLVMVKKLNSAGITFV